MQSFNDKPSGIKATKTAVVEVKLWEAFLLHNRHNLFETLSTYSLDNGPLEKGNEELTTVSFRFMVRDWNNTLKNLLDLQNVPVIRETQIISEETTLWHA